MNFTGLKKIACGVLEQIRLSLLQIRNPDEES